MFRLKPLGSFVNFIDRVILLILGRRKVHSEEATYGFPIALSFVLWFSFFDALSPSRAIGDSEAIALTALIVILSFCIVRYVKVSGDLLSAQSDIGIAQVQASVERIKDEANDLLRLQKHNSKSLANGARTAYANEIRSELKTELELERSFLDLQIRELSLAVNQAKQEANLLHERERRTYEEANSAQRPVELARERSVHLEDQFKELSLKHETLQVEVDKKSNVVSGKREKIATLQSEIAQLEIRLKNMQIQMANRRNQRRG